MRRLVVVTYNIHKGVGLDGALDLERIAEVIRETEAEVIGLQEVVHRRGIHQARVIARALGMEWIMGVTRRFPDGASGNAILSRFGILDAREFDLTCPGREPRGGLRADIAVGGGSALHLFNVHLGLGPRERRAQFLRLLFDGILRGANLNGPRVLLGDFNEWIPRRFHSHLVSEFAAHRRQRRSHPAPFPLFSLDRIYWDAHVAGERPHVHRSRLARVASDHLPVVARLRLPR
jgi:endonuclease/exonuclease/phosphatase family metal-dependent hydrolase